MPSEASPVKVEKPRDKRKKNKGPGSESDTDFQISESENEDSAPEDAAVEDGIDDLRDVGPQPTKGLAQQSPKAISSKQSIPNGAGTSHFSLKNSRHLSDHSFSTKATYTSSAAVNTSLSSTGIGQRAVPAPNSKRVQGAYGQTFSHSPSSNICSSSFAIFQRSTSNAPFVVKPFVRAQMPVRSPLESSYGQYSDQMCFACHTQHPRGACPLKVAGVEHCGLCGLAHFGYSRTCPHIRSETQVRDMLRALKNSPEKKEHVEAAVKYLRGVKGTLVQQKKKDRERAMMQAQGIVPNRQPYGGPLALPGHHPPTTYNGPDHAIAGSVSSHSSAQHAKLPQQQHRPLQPPALEDDAVESALRGFLGR